MKLHWDLTTNSPITTVSLMLPRKLVKMCHY